MSHSATDPHSPLIDLSGMTLKELESLGDRAIEESLREVLDPGGEIAAAGFDSIIETPSSLPVLP